MNPVSGLVLNEGKSSRKERVSSQCGRDDLKASPPYAHLAEQRAITVRRSVTGGQWALSQRTVVT